MAYKFSPSSLSLLCECPRCFYLDYNKNIKRPRGIFPSLPSGMDKVLKTYFDSYRKKGRLPPELANLGSKVTLFQDEGLLADWRSNFRGIRWEDGDGNLLRGAVDEILQKGKKLIILDFKTRGFPVKEDTHESYQDQLDIYTFLLEKNGHKTEGYAYLLFVHPTGVDKKGKVVFHPHLIKLKTNPENAKKIMQKALKTLKGKMPKPGKDCECCRFAMEYGKTIRL